MEIKKGKLNTSHRYDLLPLLPSGPGGIQRELVVYDLPDAKVGIFFFNPKKSLPDIDSKLTHHIVISPWS